MIQMQDFPGFRAIAHMDEVLGIPCWNPGREMLALQVGSHSIEAKKWFPTATSEDELATIIRAAMRPPVGLELTLFSTGKRDSGTNPDGTTYRVWAEVWVVASRHGDVRSFDGKEWVRLSSGGS